MADLNKTLAEMEKEVSEIYKKASDEISDKWNKYMKSHSDKMHQTYDDLQAAIKSGDAKAIQKAKDTYEHTLKNITLNNEKFKAMVNETTTKLAHTNEVALDYLNGNMAKVYTAGYNSFSDQSISGYTFTLVNEQAIKNLAAEDKSLLPTKKLNIPKDKAWNQKSINAEVLQGILQGENIPTIAKRLGHVTDMNEKSAIRNARTMVTSAENKGRQDSFVKAEKDGVIMVRRWVAAHDDRTRAWHGDLNGVEVGVNEPFKNDYGEIMYPGDPTADPANVYNCRCSIRSVIKGFNWSQYATSTYTSQYASQYQSVSVTAQYYSMLDEDKVVGNEFWKALNAEGKPSQVWKDYLAGNTTPEVTAKFDTILSKYKGTGKPVKPGAAKKVATVIQQPKPDLTMYQDKSMTATFYSVKAENTDLGKEFWSVLQAEDHPSDVWNQYLLGVAPQEVTEKLDKILLQHKGTGAWSKPVGAKAAAKKAAKTANAVDNTDELAKAQAKLAQAQDDLDKLGKKTYSGIWKDDVTLADYEAKAATIQAKKDWYQVKIDAGIDVDKYENYIKELEEFETKGKLYVQYKAEYDKIAKEVRRLTPVSDMFGPDAYTQARKDAALWAKSNAEYKTLDKYYDDVAREIKKNRTYDETEGMYHYTWGSMPFNSPLAGFKGDRYTNFVGVNKVDINVGGYGSKIRGLTSLVEKSSYDKDIWLQSAQDEITIEAFLGIKPGSLHNMSLKDAQQFVGVENLIPQFISTAVQKGGGSYNPGNMTLNIYCPAGSELLYILEDGRFEKHEKEMILQRGGTYKLTRIYQDIGTHGRKEWIVDLEVHPENGYNKFQQ